MARKTIPLTAIEIKNAKLKDKEYKLSDGNGLYLLVTPSGGKLWRLKYRFEGKEKGISLGKYPVMSLSEARRERERLRNDISNKIDPAQVRKEEKNKVLIKETKKINTFEHVAKAYLEKRNELNEAYLLRLQRAFKNDVFPFLNNRPIDEITPKDIINIVKRVEKRGAIESAHRLFTQINKVLKYAVSNQVLDRNPCAEMDKSEILKSHTRKNYPTITSPDKIKNLLLAIDEYTGDYTVKMALKLAPYVFVRPYNIRFAQWNEIDFIDKQWIIPKEKMKTKKEHIIPLSDTAVGILKEMYEYSADARYIFHSLRSKTAPMSDATLNNALRRLGYSKDELVVHGFRAMFSTITHEKSGFDHHVIELQLAHSVGSKVSQAYNRSLRLNERKELMKWWSDWLDLIQN